VLRLPPLYAIVDPLDTGADPVELAAALLAGGARLLQLRLKEATSRELLRVAEAIRSHARAAGAVFLVNDRPDIARAVDADGVHLGQDDLPVAAARRILGPGPLIGRSSHSPDQSDVAAAEPGVDYFCAGPLWTTPTKPGRPATGLGLPRHVAGQHPDRPWFAIGGISLDRLDDVLAAGATRVVVVRAITEADDPAAATRAFARRLH